MISQIFYNGSGARRGISMLNKEFGIDITIVAEKSVMPTFGPVSVPEDEGNI